MQKKKQKAKRIYGACTTHIEYSIFILQVTSVQFWRIFPPKDLEKIRRLKYACATFFKNTSYVFQVYYRGNELNILLVLFVYYYYYLLLIKQIFVSFFIVLKYILNKPQKSHKVFILFNHKIIIKVVVEEKVFI